MIPIPLRARLSLGSFVLLISTSAAQSWSDDFDSYTEGALVDPFGQVSIGNGWESWSTGTGSSTVAGPMTLGAPAASSPPHSLSNNPSADTVNRFYGYPGGHPTSGVWTFAGSVYHPSSYLGRSYWLMMNTYAFGGPYGWSGQVYFDGDTNVVDCDCVGLGVQRTLIRDAWVPFRAEIDLDGDVVDVFYGGDSLTGGQGYAWSQGVFGGMSGLLEIQALDLYPDVPGSPNTTESFYDDLSLTSTTPPIATVFCTAVPNSSGQSATFTALSPGVPGDPLAVHIDQGPPANFGYCLTSANQATLPVGAGILCLGPPFGRYNSLVFVFDAGGVARAVQGGGPIVLPTDLLPHTMAPVQEGETWSFQAWFRDGPTSNFSDGLAVTFSAFGPQDVFVTNVTPNAGSAGTQITITGQNFDPDPRDNLVLVGGRTAAAFVSVASPTSLTADVTNSGNVGSGEVRVVTGSSVVTPPFPVTDGGFTSTRIGTVVFTGSREGAGSSFDYTSATANTVEASFDGAVRVNLGPLGPWVANDTIAVELYVHSPVGWTSAAFRLQFGPGVGSTLACARHLGLQLEDLGVFDVGVAGTAVAVSVQGADAGFGAVFKL